MYPDYEHILGPGSTVFKPSKVKIHNSKFEAFLYEFELRDCIGHCANIDKPLSPCVQEYFDAKYGTGFNNSMEKAHMMKMLKLYGQTYVMKNTNCSVPCLTYEYNLTPFVSQHIDHLLGKKYAFKNHYQFKDPGLKLPVLLIINHQFFSIDESTDYLKSINETNGSVLVIGHIEVVMSPGT